MALAECRNGHDLAVLGRYTTGSNRGKCVACNRAKRQRLRATPHRRAYEAQKARTPERIASQNAWAQSPNGRRSHTKAILQFRMREKIARLTELESVALGLGFTPDQIKEMTVAA